MIWQYRGIRLNFQPCNLAGFTILKKLPSTGNPMKRKSLLIDQLSHGEDTRAIRHHYKFQLVIQLFHPCNNTSFWFYKSVGRFKGRSVIKRTEALGKMPSVPIDKI